MTLFSTLFFSLLLASCTEGDTAEGKAVQQEEIPTYTELVNTIVGMPEDYERNAIHTGNVLQLEYKTRDYVSGTMDERTNTAYVYLPYGYKDTSDQSYNVMYFIHGHDQSAATLFQEEDGLVRNLLDHMIENGDIAPTIIVAPSYYYGEPPADFRDEDCYCKAFPQELVNDLMPLVESRFPTYSSGTDSAGLVASSSHRAIGGFSNGAVSVWYALEQYPKYFKFFMPVSSDCWSLGVFGGYNQPDETASYLASVVKDSGLAPGSFHVWTASGSDDVAFDRISTQVQAMAKITEVFPVESLTFHVKEGAKHEFRPLAEYLYNALPFFFPQ